MDNRYSLQQDGRYCNMDNDNEVKVILPRNFFLTKTVTNLVSRKNIEQVRTVELLFDNIFIA